jgi:DNA-binding XRE family transcriptional regulator
MSSRAKSKGLQSLVDEFIGDDPERSASFEKACDDLEIGVELNRMRTEAGLSTRALAQKVGTQASVISRIEQASYGGHSLSMLRRVAAALGHRVEIRFRPIGETPAMPNRASAKTAGKTGPAKAKAVGNQK